MTRNVTNRFADDLKDTALGQDEIPQGGLDDFGSNSGGVPPRNADANDIHGPKGGLTFLPLHQIGRRAFASAKAEKDGQARELPFVTNAGAEVVDVTLHEQTRIIHKKNEQR